jgi:hypothetical protein
MRNIPNSGELKSILKNVYNLILHTLRGYELVIFKGQIHSQAEEVTGFTSPGESKYLAFENYSSL